MRSEKEITADKSVEKRQYGDACAAAHALDLIGDRWALPVMRELMFGPKRFTNLRRDLPTISANVLTQRLEGLEAAGVLTRHKLPPPASAWVYELTDWGYAAEKILQELGRWGTMSPLHDPTKPISANSLLLSLRTLIDAKRAKGVKARIGFRFGDETFVGKLADGALKITRGQVKNFDLLFVGEPRALAGAVYGGVPLNALIAEGTLKVEGDRALAERFLGLFPLPGKIAKQGS
ncbi:winged helix-turn-helix transcriptional regulator [Beijerinckia indica]|uniref:Transcriptional regulator, HxlR family n=1 Tax=Beijerinckia indica subsp. indica (strain ATCC 9039 / DSM 1715 / NCIMB 8712) TaxID=395963 RepID=B2ID25_BEII9|nr:winged helix-turn-helix transcriptional regulator [Beijerinckia indica]ACB96790.1 transcriptional regulator, HxlR family [Beijerinckia indica subsp. indica ATCC 9039]